MHWGFSFSGGIPLNGVSYKNVLGQTDNLLKIIRPREIFKI